MKSKEKSLKQLEASLLLIQKIPKSKDRRYSKEHQNSVVEAFLKGMSLSDVHRLTAIPIKTLRAWKTRSFENNFVHIPISESLKEPTRALILLSDAMRIELSGDHLTSELIQRLKQAI